MKILVINCGSSSIKYKLYKFPGPTLIAKGLIEQIGEKASSIKDHTQGIQVLFKRLLRQKVIRQPGEISSIGHRVVHGAETVRKPNIINDRLIKTIKKYSELAPLHNPVNLAGIMGCRKIAPKVKQVAVFDTAFHQTIPQYAYMYALPFSYYKKYGVRKYGFHGTSHQFVAKQAAQILGKPLSKINLITCHLGNGCSITAIKKGKSIDTSMGFTPLEGLIMGTRSGDIDVAAVFYLMQKEKLSLDAMDKILNRKSGLLGISGISNDIRPIKDAAKRGNQRTKLALEMFLYRVKKYIGAYYCALCGADAICFTGGIGENNPRLIARLKNDISCIVPKKTKFLIVPTDEELMIAQLTRQFCTKRPLKRKKKKR
ncbi:MAG: acetate kinase [Candidatus Omnitrophota bacterium]|nr:MAG: acetate kinase [Candidatus Omnitrophota bacterium]